MWGGMATVDTILSGPLLSGLTRVSPGGGDREVSEVRLAEQFADLSRACADSFVILGRAASAETFDYRFDMGVRWAGIQGVAAIAAFSADTWQPPATAADIAGRAGISLISVPDQAELTWLVAAVMRETGGSAELALSRAETGLDAVTRAEAAGADLETLRQSVADALGTRIEARAPFPGETGVAICSGGTVFGYLTAPEAHGDMAIAARLALNAAASAAARLLDAARRARELPVRSRSELLAEVLISESALNEDLLDRARQLGVPLGGWHVAVRLEADNLDEAGRDEVHQFELLEIAGQVGLQAVTSSGGTWYLSRVARTVVLIRMAGSDPGHQGSVRAVRAAERALQAIGDRLPALRLRAGVGTPHEGPMGLRASASEARVALLAARTAGKAERVVAHDAAGIQRMLLEWYASDTARASVRSQLAPLDRLGTARRDTAIRTLAAYLDEQGSIVKTARRLHLHRNAVSYRLRRITELLGVDFTDPDHRLALHLACRAHLME
jgi:sugar diacid utilization regulator